MSDWKEKAEHYKDEAEQRFEEKTKVPGWLMPLVIFGVIAVGAIVLTMVFG